MLVVATSGMAALLLIAYTASRNMLFPPALFSAVWFGSLAGLLVAGELFFPVSGATYLVYLIGALAFLAGGIAVLLGFQLTSPGTALERRPIGGAASVRLALDALLVFAMIGLPFYWQKIATIAGDVRDDLVLHNIRNAMVDRSNESAPLGLVGNFSVLAYLLALAMVYELDGTWKRAVRMLAAVGLSLAYGLMSGTKGSAVVLFLTIFFISWVKSGELRIWRLLLMMGASIVVFGVGLLVINLIYLPLSDFETTLSLLGESILNYWLGGLVGFDRIVQDPSVMESAQPIWRFFLETARSFGWNGYVPNLHADYSLVGPSLESNTYTIYFTYFKDWSWAGMGLLMFSMGGLLTFLHLESEKGGPKAVMLYAMMCVAIALSFHAEHFFLGLNGYLKAMAFLYLVYNVIPYFSIRLQSSALHHA